MHTFATRKDLLEAGFCHAQVDMLDSYIRGQLADQHVELRKESDRLYAKVGENTTQLIVNGTQVPLGKFVKGIIALAALGVGYFLYWYYTHQDEVSETMRRNVTIALTLFTGVMLFAILTTVASAIKARRLPPVLLEGDAHA